MHSPSPATVRYLRPSAVKPGLLIAGLALAALLLPVCAAAISHPSLLFNDISETPGYQHRTEQPWIGWENSIRANADRALALDFSNPAWTTAPASSYNRLIYRSAFARDLGLMYQISKDPKYAQKALETLEYIGVTTETPTLRSDRALALAGYAIAYDCIQPTLAAATDTKIRDKLATFTDGVYRDLNEDGTNKGYVTFADYHGQAYPNVAIAGMALADYTNPNKLALSGTPAEWQKCGTDYMFTDDLLHSYHRSLFSFGFDESSGKHLLGSYKWYVLEEFTAWMQVYSHVKGRSIFIDYPVAKKAFTSEVWESLPNNYHNNYVTSGNTKETYMSAIVNLLSDTDKRAVLWHNDAITGDASLPYSGTYGTAPTYLLYLTYGDYRSLARTPPSYTSVLNPDAVYQVLRSDWTDDADWLSMITFTGDTRSNRDSAHHDQLSIEYYSHGNLLLADGGENKYVLDKYYGAYDVHHNTVAVEDPETPFSVASWSDSAARGFFKGDAGGIDTPADVGVILQTAWMEVLEASVTASSVIGSSWGAAQQLSSPIGYERVILFPGTEYFAVIDRLDGSEPWVYRSLFRPASLSITPTKDANGDHVYTEAETGHVNGALTVGGSIIGWTSLPYKSETDTGVVTGDIRWTTQNPDGQTVELTIATAPAAEVLVTKHVGRIAGYGDRSEVFSPVLSLRGAASEDAYRITALLPRYTSEPAFTAREIAVDGTGTALAISGPGWADLIYTGSGTAAFETYATDAETVHIRTDADGRAATVLHGTSVTSGGSPWISLPESTGAFSMHQQGSNIMCSITGSGSGTIAIAGTGTVTTVLRDGTPYTGWTQEADGIAITTTLSSHVFEITTSAAANTAPALSWTGTTGYTADGLNPESGTADTAFDFRITYTDADGDAPLAGYPKVHIVRAGKEISGSPFAMTKVAGTPATGSVYAYTTTLAPGTDYSYFFEARDSRGAAAPSTAAIPAPDVAEAVTAWLRGDLNDNGKIDIGDVAMIASMASDYIADDIRGDFNENGVIDSGDADMLADFFLGKISEI